MKPRRSPSAPPEPKGHGDKAGWHRRFTWAVSQLLVQRNGERGLTPAEAGEKASAETRLQFTTAYPGVELPSWMP